MDKLNTELQHPRDQITEIIKRIYNAGMTTPSGGNISIIDKEGNKKNLGKRTVVLSPVK